MVDRRKGLVRSENSGKRETSLEDLLPFDQSAWDAVIEALHFTPQQTRVVELILQAKPDKEIAAALGLRRSTVRGYVRRIFLQTGVDTRLSLAIRICRLARDCALTATEGGPG